MTTSVQRRRGTTAQHSTFTGLEGEITIDTTKDTAVIHDGATVGGYPLVKESLSNANPTPLTALSGAGTASDDVFLVYDTSTSTQKKITRAELKNAIELETFTNITISGGSINGTAIGSSTASTGNFTALYIGGAQITSSVAELNLLDGVTATTTELNYVDGVTSNIQTQLDAKAPLSSPTFTGTLATAGLNVTDNSILGNSSADTLQINATPTLAVAPTLSYETANRVPYINGDKLLTSSANFTYDGASLGLAGQLNLTNASNYNLYASGAGANYMAGNLGIGTTPSVVYGTLIGGNITGGSIAAGIRFQSTFQSDVSNFGRGFISIPSTAAASFTLGNLEHFGAYQGTIGAGSVVTSQYGFTAGSTITGATNNYGFYGNIAAASNRWNLYMAGTADNYMAGRLGIGAAAGANEGLTLSKNITGSTTSTNFVVYGQIQPDVTTLARGMYTQLAVAASTTLTSIHHYSAYAGAFGSGASVANQIGVYIQGALTGATNNYAFFSDMAAGTGRWNLYMNGSANNYLAGSLGIGSGSLTDRNLSIGKNITGAATAYGILQNSTIQSDVTNNAYIYHTNVGTQATAFTLGALFHYSTSQSTIGAGSTVTAQYGFTANSNLTGATYNYGFYGDIAAGTNRYNLYMNGTANNYLAGSLTIGGAPSTGINFKLNKTLTGATTAYGYTNQCTIQSDVTTIAYLNYTGLSTQATTFTLPLGVYYHANQETIGAGSTVTTQVGFLAQSTLTGATNNRGFQGSLAAATNAYNLFMSGTASNYLAGSLGIGSTPDAVNKVLVAGVLPLSASSSGGIRVSGTFPASTVTGVNFDSIPYTQATAFTLTTLYQFRAYAPQLGAGSAITSNFAYFADPTNTNATNNFGFYSGIPSGTGRYNLYMAGTADNYMAGSLGIGTAPSAGFNLQIQKNLTGSTTGYNVYSNPAIQSDVTSVASAYLGTSSTQATAFTLTSYRHFDAAPMTIGAGSTVTAQIGYLTRAGFTGATNNQAFVGNLAAATGTYNIYMAGTADNYLAGNLGIGALTTGATLTVRKNLTGATTAYGILEYSTVASDVTGGANFIQTFASTQAAAFTLGTLNHFYANQDTIGAGSAVTTQQGFVAESSITGATNNYGFKGNIAAATGRYNLYMSGTAPSYFAGRVGIGGLPSSSINLLLSNTITGNAISAAMYSNGVVQSDVTSIASGFSTSIGTQATAFTLNSLYHYDCGQGTIGAGSSLTTQIGYFVRTSVTGATNNYGFYSQIAAATGRYNLYMGGTADNYLAGNLGIGVTSPQVSLDVQKASDVQIRARETGSGVDNRFSAVGGAGLCGITGTYSNHPLVIYSNATEKLRITTAGQIWQNSTVAIPAGGTTGLGHTFSSTSNFGIFFGSGAPTLSAAKGSLYLRSDGSATNNRMYVNTDGGTTWTAVTTAA